MLGVNTSVIARHARLIIFCSGAVTRMCYFWMDIGDIRCVLLFYEKAVLLLFFFLAVRNLFLYVLIRAGAYIGSMILPRLTKNILLYS